MISLRDGTETEQFNANQFVKYVTLTLPWMPADSSVFGRSGDVQRLKKLVSAREKLNEIKMHIKEYTNSFLLFSSIR